MIPGIGLEGTPMGKIRDTTRNERVFGRFLTRQRNVRELFAVTMTVGVVLRLAYIVYFV